MINQSLEGLAVRLQEATAGAAEPDLLTPDSVWNLSQTIQHCAQTIGYSVTGYPKLKPRAYRATVGALENGVSRAGARMRPPPGAETAGPPPLDPALAV